MFILETLEALQKAIRASDTAEIDRLLDVPIEDMSMVSHSSVCLRDFLIGSTDDIHGVLNYPWEVSPFKAASECWCRIYEHFCISDSVSTEGKSIADVANTFDENDLD